MLYWCLTSCKPVGRYQHCGETYRLCLHPEDGGSVFLRNIGIYRRVYVTSNAIAIPTALTTLNLTEI
jgi:hypothetical protein